VMSKSSQNSPTGVAHAHARPKAAFLARREIRETRGAELRGFVVRAKVLTARRRIGRSRKSNFLSWPLQTSGSLAGFAFVVSGIFLYVYTYISIEKSKIRQERVHIPPGNKLVLKPPYDPVLPEDLHYLCPVR